MVPNIIAQRVPYCYCKQKPSTLMASPPKMNTPMTKQDLIHQLQLTAHVEGGYFRRTYASTRLTSDQPERACMSSIFYLLTDDSPIGHLHCNRSDIVHYYHAGNGQHAGSGQGSGILRYTLIHPGGFVEEVLLGPDLAKGHRWQLTVPGGVWKASELICGEWGLISEAVCPGFDFADMQLAGLTQLQALLPEAWQRYHHLVHRNA